MGLRDLPTLGEVNATRRATPKHEIVPRVLAKEQKAKTRKANEDTFRAEVWKRDGGKCRATGMPLSRGGMDWKTVGEVDHALERSTNPDKVYDVSNGILIQKYLNRLRKVRCRLAPEFRAFDYSGDVDRGKPQTFRWRDDEGRVIRETVG